MRSAERVARNSESGTKKHCEHVLVVSYPLETTKSHLPIVSNTGTRAMAAVVVREGGHACHTVTLLRRELLCNGGMLVDSLRYWDWTLSAVAVFGNVADKLRTLQERGKPWTYRSENVDSACCCPPP